MLFKSFSTCLLLSLFGLMASAQDAQAMNLAAAPASTHKMGVDAQSLSNRNLCAKSQDIANVEAAAARELSEGIELSAASELREARITQGESGMINLNHCPRRDVVAAVHYNALPLVKDGQYILPALPYAADALEPFLDEETVKLHHERHQAAYVKGANKAAKLLREIAFGEKDASLAAGATRDLAFHLSGHVMHNLYWQSIAPHPSAYDKPNGALAYAITANFGNYEGFVKIFKSVTLSLQGSGWGVLGLDMATGRLVICAVEKHQNSVIPGFQALIACDVWEHAYYLRYKNDRAGYIDAFLNQIDWTHAQDKFNLLMRTKRLMSK